MTDSHNSGQHKDREAAAAEVRRMWQPTPSWTQPDPNADAESAEDTETDALSEDFSSGDTNWSRPVNQPAPWTQPNQPAPAAPTASWAQPAADPAAASWTQPEEEDDDALSRAADGLGGAGARAGEDRDGEQGAGGSAFGGSSFSTGGGAGGGLGPDDAGFGQPAGGEPGQGGQAGQSGRGGLAGQDTQAGQGGLTGDGGQPGQSGPAGQDAQLGQGGLAGQDTQGRLAGQDAQAGQGGLAGQGGQAGSGAAAGAAGQGAQAGQAGAGGQGLSPAAQAFFPQGVPGQQHQQPQNLSYRSDELLQALPLPREAPAERGVRSVLKLRPGSSERSERIARATAATAFRRPVTIVVANPKGGSGKTPTTLLLAGALGQARGGGVVAWDNNELRGNMHLRTHDTNSRSTVTDMLQAMPMLTQPDARLGDVAAYLRHQVSGQYDVLTSATTTYAQIEAKDFDQIHRLMSRFYKVLVIDTGNNEGSSNWREAMKAADALVIPIKWKSLSCAAAVQMLEELDNQGPEAQRLIRRAVIAVSNGPGDVNKEVEKQLRPYFDSRAAAVVDIPTDMHIAAEGPLDHSALQPATRRAALELAARVSEQITKSLNTPR
ncbi:MinD/ParA family ATP-binding protein [Kribbella solani]|uniref:MinD/ParA family ATP-binding protein n=1 Tax=Kribbella solani TaxID=236067 RepID=UPI0029A43E20|nr:AAA family ATPase [Kribbella solani]MDX2968467.1 AAA family ATPase [Kribbella solani]